MATPKETASEHELQIQNTAIGQEVTDLANPATHTSKLASAEPTHTSKTTSTGSAHTSKTNSTPTPASSTTHVSKPNSNLTDFKTSAAATTTTLPTTPTSLSAALSSSSISKTTTTTVDATKTVPASAPCKRIRYTKQQMLALAKERVSLQRPANLPVEATVRPRYRENNSNSNSNIINSNSNNNSNYAKDKIGERDRENKERDDSSNKTYERPLPKEQPKPAEPKPRKGDRYGTPSWFNEDVDPAGTFTFGTLDREADRAQMKLDEGKPEDKSSDESLKKSDDNSLDKPLESDAESESDEGNHQVNLPASKDVELSLPHQQNPEPDPMLPSLERLSIREPSNKAQPTAIEQGWNTWPSLFGPLFPGFANEPPRHDPWSDKQEEPAETRKTTASIISSVSDQTAALKSMLKIGGENLNSLTKPGLASSAVRSSTPPEWANDVHAHGDLGWGGLKREQEFASKHKAHNGWPDDAWQEGQSGWQEAAVQDAQWREGITGWQTSEAESSWPESGGRSARVEWHSRDPRGSEGSDEVIMFRPGSSASEPSVSPAYNTSFNTPLPVDAQWSNPTVSLSASSNAATVAKRSATVNVQTLFNLNLPNRNPPPRAVMASTLENRQLVRTASLSHSERERTLDSKSLPLSRPTVSFTQSPSSETRTLFPQVIRHDQSQDNGSEYMARMVSRAHLQRKTAPSSPSAPTPSVTFSNRQPPMRYSQNQFGRSATQSAGLYSDPPPQQNQPYPSSKQQTPSHAPSQQQALFYQQNSQFILQHSQQPASSHYQAYPSQQQYSQPQQRTGFSNLSSSTGTAGPLDKWFGHMLPKPNPSR